MLVIWHIGESRDDDISYYCCCRCFLCKLKAADIAANRCIYIYIIL